MAKPKKDSTEKTTVTRISASDSKASTKSVKNSATKKNATSRKKAEAPKKLSTSVKMEAFKRGEIERSRNPLKVIWHYFVGAWHELKQVRWPTRGATWSLTGAVLAFTLFFVLFIVFIDAVFKYLFEFILK